MLLQLGHDFGQKHACGATWKFPIVSVCACVNACFSLYGHWSVAIGSSRSLSNPESRKEFIFSKRWMDLQVLVSLSLVPVSYVADIENEGLETEPVGNRCLQSSL